MGPPGKERSQESPSFFPRKKNLSDEREGELADEQTRKKGSSPFSSSLGVTRGKRPL